MKQTFREENIMDEKTIREIITMLAEEKRKYVKISEEVINENTQQVFYSKVGGINIALDKICKFADENGIDVSDIKW